jgi:hypothetical protein
LLSPFSTVLVAFEKKQEEIEKKSIKETPTEKELTDDGRDDQTTKSGRRCWIVRYKSSR